MRELGTFLVNYPCWVLIHKKSMVLDEQGRMKPPLSFMLLDDQLGGTTFPAFSDGDLASRFLNTRDDAHDFTIVAAISSKILAEALKASRGIADAMSFDQPAMRTKPYGFGPLNMPSSEWKRVSCFNRPHGATMPNEKAIREHLSKTLDILEPGLTLVLVNHPLPNEVGAEGFIGILAKDCLPPDSRLAFLCARKLRC